MIDIYILFTKSHELLFTANMHEILNKSLKILSYEILKTKFVTTLVERDGGGWASYAYVEGVEG
jgi:hypothetical protein